MPKRPLTRGEKWLFGATIPLITLLIGAGALVNVINQPPDITIPPPPAVPRPNGYDLYVRAAKSIVIPTPAVDPVSDTVATLPPAQAAQRYSLARREAWLKANRAGLAIFEQALHTPCAVPIQRQGDSSLHGPLRELARAKVAEVNTCKMRGQMGRANTIGLDIIQMGGDISNGTVLDFLVGSAIRALGARALEDMPSKISGAEALAAAKRLEALYPPHEQMTGILEQEKWNALSDTLALMKKPTWRNGYGGITGAATASPGARFRMQTISKRHVIEELASIHDAVIAESKQPYSAQVPPRPEPSNLLVSQMQPFGYGRFTLARDQALLSLLLHRYALRAYRVDHGRYPDTLQALVPHYVSHNYPDPFGNGSAPLYYKRSGDSYKLWSVGTDGRNDNARSVPKVSRPNQIFITQNQKGDIVVEP